MTDSKKTAPGETGAAHECLRRMINANFTGQAILSSLDYQNPDEFEGGSNRKDEHMRARIAELLKYLDAGLPVPACDQQGTQLHSRLKRLSREVRSG